MKISSNSGEVISLQEAKEFTASYRLNDPTGIKAYFIGRDNISKILNQTDCIGIRIYNGIDEVNGNRNLVFVGVDSNEKDMTNGIIVERVVICPPHCDSSSELLT